MAKEYIEREAVLLAIMQDGCKASNIEVITKIPAADVAEAVRCKNCAWWEAREYGSTIGRCENPRNGLIYEYTDDSDFCSYGERKEK